MKHGFLYIYACMSSLLNYAIFHPVNSSGGRVSLHHIAKKATPPYVTQRTGTSRGPHKVTSLKIYYYCCILEVFTNYGRNRPQHEREVSSIRDRQRDRETRRQHEIGQQEQQATLVRFVHAKPIISNRRRPLSFRRFQSFRKLLVMS